MGTRSKGGYTDKTLAAFRLYGKPKPRRFELKDEVVRPIVGSHRKYRRVRRKGLKRVMENAGTIKKVVEDRGFGFITPSHGGKDIFFHVTVLEGLELSDLSVGQRVRYSVEVGDKGPKATRVGRM